jgi:hypothetical protein
MFDVHRDADVPPGKTTPAAKGRRRRRRGRRIHDELGCCWLRKSAFSTLRPSLFLVGGKR